MDVRESLIRHHIPYEIWMMRDSLAAALKGAPTQFLQNLHVEGFALHAGNLIDFLKNADNCGFDPTDFTTAAFHVERTFIRDTLVETMNRQISHLTAGRTEKHEEKFDESHWRETAEAVEKELDRWIKCLKPEWAKMWEQQDLMGEVVDIEVHVSLKQKVGFTLGAILGPVMIIGWLYGVFWSSRHGTFLLFAIDFIVVPVGAIHGWGVILGF